MANPSAANELPVPQDDGGARHLTGTRMPDISLAATNGSAVNFAKLSGRTVIYAYPRTGGAGQSPARRLGRDPGRHGLHAAILRLP